MHLDNLDAELHEHAFDERTHMRAGDGKLALRPVGVIPQGNRI